MYIGLFFSAFLAATVVPHSSEATFFYVLYSGGNLGAALFWATLGNTLGAMTCYGLGRVGSAKHVERWLKIPGKKVLAMEAKVKRWGAWLGLFSWLPLVGDLLAVALGFFRIPAGSAAVAVVFGKFFRYAFLAWAWHGARALAGG